MPAWRREGPMSEPLPKILQETPRNQWTAYHMELYLHHLETSTEAQWDALFEEGLERTEALARKGELMPLPTEYGQHLLMRWGREQPVLRFWSLLGGRTAAMAGAMLVFSIFYRP